MGWEENLLKLSKLFSAKERRKQQEIELEQQEIMLEVNKLKKKERKIAIKKEAELIVYGESKTKRISLTRLDREEILNKFNNECVICCEKEGLHIHHKNRNATDNKISNLSLLCGVCHKKIHMKVR